MNDSDTPDNESFEAAISAVSVSPEAGTEFKNAIRWAVSCLSAVVAATAADKLDAVAWKDIEGAFEDFGRDLNDALDDLCKALEGAESRQ